MSTPIRNYTQCRAMSDDLTLKIMLYRRMWSKLPIDKLSFPTIVWIPIYSIKRIIVKFNCPFPLTSYSTLTNIKFIPAFLVRIPSESTSMTTPVRNNTHDRTLPNYLWIQVPSTARFRCKNTIYKASSPLFRCSTDSINVILLCIILIRNHLLFSNFI